MSGSVVNGRTCSGECHRCSQLAAVTPPASAVSGARLVLAAVLSFLVPLVLAAGGALLLGPAAPRQVAGALGGLLVGGVMARLASSLWRPSGRLEVHE